jgi:Right handed beta helix region
MNKLPISLAAAMACAFAFSSAASAAVVVITHAKALAGNVTPGDTPGYPVTLSLPGSYRLATDLSPTAGKNGITASVQDITIDLNGFTLSGGPIGGANNGLNGIVGSGARLTIQNGKINSFKASAIIAPNSPYLIVENVRIITSVGIGIDNTGGSFARIQNNTVASNGADAISCGISCFVQGNVVSGNGGNGITLVSGGVMENTINDNTGFGIFNFFNPADTVSCHNAFFGNGAAVNNVNVC